jgi:transposase
MAMTIVETARLVTGGVDTHLDVHVAAAVDASGGVLGVESFPTTSAGYVELHAWLVGFGTLRRVGVEGTGAYGAGLARYLRHRELEVIALALAVARPPDAVISRTTSSSGSSRRPDSPTDAPNVAKRSAIARPSPDPPPVITATFPSSLGMSHDPFL